MASWCEVAIWDELSLDLQIYRTIRRGMGWKDSLRRGESAKVADAIVEGGMDSARLVEVSLAL